MATEATQSSIKSSTNNKQVKETNKEVIASSITVNLDVQAKKPNVIVVQAKKPNVIVAIPAYNEETAIASVVLRSFKYADKVIVIDDGSKDKTVEIARLAGAEVISHKTNEGKGATIRDAFSYAKMINAEILVVIDGDGQHNPDEIPLLVSPILKGEADLVNGSRFVNGSGHHVPRYRRIGQEVLTAATNTGTKMHITDSQNGFRAFSKKTFDCFSFGQSRMAIESKMLIDAAHANLRIKEVPIDVRYDVKGSTYNPVRHGFGVLGHVISLISQRRPLIFFCIPGTILLIIGIVAAFLTFNEFNVTRNISAGYAMVTSVCVMLGITSIFTGFTLNSIQNIGLK